uniref:Uncharacterized protein n=1 Tax=Amphilophus citrinellus TaxID=61819 RepID=A0A3Q0T1Q3_AMPCI
HNRTKEISISSGGAVVSAPLVLGAVGFTSAGIATGSYAASMMSAAAVANGGGVAAGSLVAVLQSAGAAGLSATAGGVGGAAAGLRVHLFVYTKIGSPVTLMKIFFLF